MAERKASTIDPVIEPKTTADNSQEIHADGNSSPELKTDNVVVLVPRPSDDPRDPLVCDLNTLVGR